MKKWYTIKTYVDHHSGEILKEHDIKSNRYIVINKTTKHIIQKNHGEKQITYECERNRQSTLF